MAVVPAVGLALSAISTVKGISDAGRAARRQDEALEMSAADAKQRIEMAQEEFEFVKGQAQRLHDQEILMVDAQRRSSQASLTQQILSTKMQQIQARMEAQGIRSQAQEIELQMKTQALQEASMVGEQNTAQLRELNNAQVQIPGQMGTRARELQEERAGNVLQEARGAILEESQVRRGLSDENVRMSGIMGGVQRRMMEVAADNSLDQARMQMQLVRQQEPHARRAINLQAQRNRQALEAKLYSTQATANMAALSASVQEREYIRGVEAQRSQIQRPGFLSYMQAGVGVFNQGMQLGLWNQPRSRFDSNNLSFAQQYSVTPTTNFQAPNLSGQLGFSQSPLMDRLNSQQSWSNGRITDIPGNIYG